MEKTIRREGMNQELILGQAEGNYSNLEIAMLRNNQMKYLLPVQIQTMNGEACYLYDISGYYSLADYYQNKEADISQVASVLREILRAMEELKDYLLSGSRLLLTEEFVYLNPEDRSVKLCYLPGYETKSGEGISRLVEFFMDHMDHKDEASIVFIYGLYKMCKEERVSPVVLKGFLQEQTERAEGKKPDAPLLPPERSVSVPTVKSKPESQAAPDLHWEKAEKLEQKRIRGWSLVWKGCQMISLLFLALMAGYTIVSCRIGSPDIRELKYNGILLLLGSSVFFLSMVLNPERKRAKDRKEPDGEDQKQQIREIPREEHGEQHTMILSRVPKSVSGKPVFRPVQKRHGRAIEIIKSPTVIGSLRDAVDQVIEDKSVSRIHASVEIECEECYLTDLKSTNGTKINGKLLVVGTPVLLRHGDKVEFGRMEYEFCLY